MPANENIHKAPVPISLSWNHWPLVSDLTFGSYSPDSEVPNPGQDRPELEPEWVPGIQRNGGDLLMVCVLVMYCACQRFL